MKLRLEKQNFIAWEYFSPKMEKTIEICDFCVGFVSQVTKFDAFNRFKLTDFDFYPFKSVISVKMLRRGN